MGLPFSAGVPFPYLHRKTWIVLKGITLVFVSGLSFVFALLVVFAAYGATWTWGSPGKLILVAASLVGTSVVLTGARYVIPLSYLPGLLTAGVFAAIPGGLIFGVLDDAQWYLAFMTWNGLIATSIHIAETRLLACVVVIEVEIGDMINRLYIETNWCVRFWPKPVSR